MNNAHEPYQPGRGARDPGDTSGGAGAVERVTADELAYYMAGALTDSEHAALTHRIEKDPEAAGLLARMNAVDDLYRAVFPPPGPEPDPHEPMPRAFAARLNARIAQLALERENAMNPDGARTARTSPASTPPPIPPVSSASGEQGTPSWPD